MSKNTLTKIGYCDSCTRRTFVAEVKLRNAKVIQLCEQCIDHPYHQLKSLRQSFREGDKTDSIKFDTDTSESSNSV